MTILHRFRLSLRTKLALVALVLLVLPWAGYEYVREMERFLLEGQEPVSYTHLTLPTN